MLKYTILSILDVCMQRVVTSFRIIFILYTNGQLQSIVIQEEYRIKKYIMCIFPFKQINSHLQQKKTTQDSIPIRSSKNY